MGKMIGYQRPDGQSVNGYTSNEMAVFAMTRGKRMFWVSFALLGAAALGAGAGSAGKRVPAFAIGAAHASEPGARHAKPGGGETTDGWVYLGRRSADGWKPPSPSISRPRFPVKPGDRLVVKRDALVYGSVDCKVIDAADFKPDGTRRSVLLVRADREGLEIAGPAVACPSIGGAKTLWASVKIPAGRLVSVEK